MYILLNGKMVPEEEAHISIFDHGYLYGMGLFETFRTYAGEPYLLGSHLDRLAESCQRIGMEWERDDQRIRASIRQLLEANNLPDAYFRLNLSAGPMPIGLPTQKYTQLTEALLLKKLPPIQSSQKLRTLQLPRNTPDSPGGRLKSHHFMNNVLARRELPAGHEGIFLTEDHKVAEGIVNNVFWVKDGRLYTPSLDTGILNGITRQWVIHMAQQLSIEVEEGQYDLDFALQADEVFVCNSVQELVFVESWDEQSFAPAHEHTVLYKLQQLYDPVRLPLNRIGDFNVNT